MPCMLRDKKVKKIAEKITGNSVTQQRKISKNSQKRPLKYEQYSR